MGALWDVRKYLRCRPGEQMVAWLLWCCGDGSRSLGSVGSKVGQLVL